MAEDIHLARECFIVEQGHGIRVRTPGRELKVVNARGGTNVYLHKEEGDLQVVDGSEQPAGSCVVSVGKEITQESLLAQVVAAGPSFTVLGEAKFQGPCLSAGADDELSVVHLHNPFPSTGVTRLAGVVVAGRHHFDHAH